MDIRKIRDNEMKEALDLVWRTFLEFEAPDYTEDGIKEFKRTIDDKLWLSKLVFYGAFEGDKLLGVIATKDFEHISLFFVDGNHHKKGIGRKLFQKVCDLNQSGFYTANSSPYAKGVYEHLGFVYLSGEQNVNGLRFYPMRNDNILLYKNESVK